MLQALWRDHLWAFERIEFQGAIAGFNDLRRLFGMLLGSFAALEPAICVKPNAVAVFSAKKLVNWNAQRFAFDVP